MLIHLLLFASLLNPQKPAVQQEIPVYDFKSFEPYLHKNTDTTYIVNFWATWCKPCIKELPAFDSLSVAYKNEKVKVILVSLDFSEKLEGVVKPFLKKKGISSEVILLDDPDANAWIEKVDKSWSGAIPATVIYKKSKRAFYERSFTYDELKEAFLKIHNQK